MGSNSKRKGPGSAGTRQDQKEPQIILFRRACSSRGMAGDTGCWKGSSLEAGWWGRGTGAKRWEGREKVMCEPRAGGQPGTGPWVGC